jgi:hypothetical protein
MHFRLYILNYKRLVHHRKLCMNNKSIANILVKQVRNFKPLDIFNIIVKIVILKPKILRNQQIMFPIILQNSEAELQIIYKRLTQ